jgi:GT2 family glycosyltransferase
MEAVLKGRENCEFVSFTHFLQTNEQKQVVIDKVDDGYILLFENDNIPSPDFLARMMDACLEYTDGCVVIPELFEEPPHRRRVNHSPSLGRIEVLQKDGRTRRHPSTAHRSCEVFE